MSLQGFVNIPRPFAFLCRGSRILHEHSSILIELFTLQMKIVISSSMKIQTPYWPGKLLQKP
jgi:hypothetical protein